MEKQIVDLSTLKANDVVRVLLGTTAFYCIVKSCTVIKEVSQLKEFSEKIGSIIAEGDAYHLTMVDISVLNGTWNMEFPAKTSNSFVSFNDGGYEVTLYEYSLEKAKYDLAIEENKEVGNILSKALQDVEALKQKYKNTFDAAMKKLMMD